MSWLVLVLSGVLKAVWATALGKSEGFTRPGPTATRTYAMATGAEAFSVVEVLLLAGIVACVVGLELLH